MRNRHSIPRRRSRGPAKIETKLYVLGHDSVAYRLVETLVSQMEVKPVFVASWAALELEVLLRPLPVDMVVVDATLDGLSGQQQVEKVCKLQPRDPVVLMKVVEMEDDEVSPEEGIEVQVFAYAPRPLQVGQFEVGYAPA